MAEKTIDDRFVEAVEELRSSEASPEAAARYLAVEAERFEGRARAIAAGLGPVDLDEFEFEAVAGEVAIFGNLLDDLEAAADIRLTEAAIEAVLEAYAARIGEDRLRVKLTTAYELEVRTHDTALPDGILGRALDGVIEQLTPYTVADSMRGWGENVITRRVAKYRRTEATG